MTGAAARSRAIGCGVVALAVMLAGCTPGIESGAVRDRSTAVFDDLVAELAAVDEAELRAVEVLPEERRPCDDGEGEQRAFTARGLLSVTTPDDAISEIVEGLAGNLDPEIWSPIDEGVADGRAWASDDGVVVALVDASPTVLIAVFPPCGV